MIRGLTHVVSIRGLSSLSCIVVGSGIQVLLVENDIVGWACRLPVFLGKGETSQKRYFKEQRRTGKSRAVMIL